MADERPPSASSPSRSRTLSRSFGDNDPIWDTLPDDAAVRIQELTRDLENAETEQWEDWEIAEVENELDILRRIVEDADDLDSSYLDASYVSVDDSYVDDQALEEPSPALGREEEEEEEEYQELDDDQYNLILAAEEGNYETLNQLIEKGTDVNVFDEDGFPALIYAAVGGFADCAELLLDYNVDPNTTAKDKSKSTAMHVAAQNGFTELVEMLHLYKANVDAQLTNGSTPLTLAAQDGSKEVVQILLKAGAKIDPEGGQHVSALYLAAQHKQTDVMQALLTAGADPCRVCTQTQNSPLSAVMTVFKDFNMLSAMLETDPDLVEESMGKMFGTPLEHAVFPAIEAEEGSKDGQMWRKFIGLLLSKKADPNVVIQPQNDDDFPTTLLIAAIEQGADLDLLKDLIGDKPGVPAPGGYTPVHMTAELGSVDAMQCLIDAKAEVNVATDKDSEDADLTPLHLAVQNGAPKAVTLLLRHKASVNVPPGCQQLSALSMAINERPMCEDKQHPHATEVFWLLLGAKADVNGGGDDVPPLVLAATLQLWAAIGALLEEGADVNRAHEGESNALTVAMMDLLEALPTTDDDADDPENVETEAEALHLIELLITAKADVDSAPSPGGRTPLQMTRNLVSRAGGLEGVDSSGWGRDAEDEVDQDLKLLSFRAGKVLRMVLGTGGDIDPEHERELKLKAAIGLQRMMRGRLARDEAKDMWRRRSASLVLQRFAFRVRQRGAMNRMRDGMVKVQNLARGYKARRRVDRMRKRRAVENKAAATIQNQFRPGLQQLVEARRARKAEEERLARIKRQEQTRLRHAQRKLEARRKKALEENEKLQRDMDMAKMNGDRDQMIAVHKRLKAIEAEWHFAQHEIEDQTLRPVLSSAFTYLKRHCVGAVRASKVPAVSARAPEVVGEDGGGGDLDLTLGKTKTKKGKNKKDKKDKTKDKNKDKDKDKEAEDEAAAAAAVYESELTSRDLSVSQHIDDIAAAMHTCTDAGTTAEEPVAVEANETIRLLKRERQHLQSERERLKSRADAAEQARKQARNKPVKAAIFKQKRRKRKKRKKKKKTATDQPTTPTTPTQDETVSSDPPGGEGDGHPGGDGDGHPGGDGDGHPAAEEEEKEPQWSDAFSEMGLEHLRTQGVGSDDVFAEDFVPHPDRIKYKVLLHQTKRMAAARRKKRAKAKRAIVRLKKEEEAQKHVKMFEMAKRQMAAKKKRRSKREAKHQQPATPPVLQHQILWPHPRAEVPMWSNPAEAPSTYARTRTSPDKEGEAGGGSKFQPKIVVTLMPFEEARTMAHQLALADRSRWIKWSASFKRPPRMPARPDQVYKKQWVSWSDWLGHGASTTRFGLSIKPRKFLLPYVESPTAKKRKQITTAPRPSTSHGAPFSAAERRMRWDLVSS